MPRKKTNDLADLGTLLGTLPPASPPAQESPAAPSLETPLEKPIPAETQTVSIANPPVEDAFLPGFAMADSPEELEGDSAAARPSAMVNAPSPLQARALEIPDGDIDSPSTRANPGNVRYESRIRVLEAYQYPGNLKGAPEWVDRNWVGYNPDFDPLRNIEPGPALRVPTRGGDEMAWCRPGDYVVRQEVTLVHGIEPDIVIEVWARESFEKNFIPDQAAPAHGLAPEMAYESG